MEHSSLRRLLTTSFVLLLVGAFPVQELRAQDSETEPYFSLSSGKTFRSEEQPSFQLYSSNVSSLEFRVYRVNDTLTFFKNLEQPNSFGGRARPLPQDLTWIERFHQLKRDLRSRLLQTVRSQYTQESRAKLREGLEARTASQKTAAPPTAAGQQQTYPAIPLLNAQQVVAVWQQRISTVRRWASDTIKFDAPGKGVYLVEATEGTLRAYTIVIVSDIAIVTKASRGRLLTYAADRVTGAPLTDLPVSILLGGKVLGEGKTDKTGVYDLSTEAPGAEFMIVMARRDNDVAVSSQYGFAISTDPDRNLMGYIYTERPIYRPGHTVYFKGILRVPGNAAYSLPVRKQIDVEVRDGDGNPVFRKTVPLSPNGTFHADFELPVDAALGHYSIAGGADVRVYGNFEVEEYRKPEYEVRVTADKNRVLQGDQITALIEARYFFGEPVANAKVTYVVHTSPYWFYPNEDDFEELDGPDYDYGGTQVDEQQGQLDAEGKLRVSIPTTVTEATGGTQDVRYRIEARVTDQANREISGSGYVVATYGSFMLRMESNRYVHAIGSTGKFTITAEDYEKRPIATDVVVELSRWRWRDQTNTVEWTTTVRTAADGKATVEIPLRAAGSFRITSRAQSPENRSITEIYYAWVAGGGDSWYGSGRERVEIIPDKPSYTPGETARVLVVTGVPEAWVLVTTEGRSLQAPQIIHTTEPTLMVDVPVPAEAAPNFFVSATFLRDNEFHYGTKSVRVPPTQHLLTVNIEPSKNEFKPGEAATYAVTTKDAAGNPTAAEVSFGLVDEAIYAIRPDAAQDITKFFYGTTYNRVNTMSSLTYYFSGSAGKRQMQLAAVRPSSALGQLKPERLLQPKVRKAFPDTALWLADVKTDSSGTAQVRVEFPDALTTWRATARAITADTKVGSAIQKTVVRKNLMLRLATPRFLTQGDEVTVSVIVHNYLQTQKTARVSLEAQGLQVIEGSTKDVPIPSRGEVRLDWKVRATGIGEIKLLGKALTDEESDAMEIPLPVIPYGVKQSTSNAGSISDSSEFSTTVTFPSTIDPASRTLEIGASPSVAGALFGGLEYLTSFPYGCTEQTMSSFLPNVMVSNALKQLKVKSNVDEVALKTKIRDGLKRLYDYQHDDGGWGWWQTDDSAPFMTSYVVAGLSQARDAGVRVDEGRLARGAEWLAKQFDGSPNVLPDLRAYVLYAVALAGKSTPARVDSVWDQRDRLSAYGLALFGLALDSINDGRVADIVGRIESMVKTNSQEAYWPMTTDPLLEFEADTTSEATAFAVKLLVKRRGASPLLPKAALWLVNHRNEGFYWNTTKQTAMVIYGLTDYLRASGELRPNFTVQVWVNDQQVLRRTFTAEDALALRSPVIRIPASQLAMGENRIRISKSGGGLLYWNTRGEYYSTEERLSRAGSSELNLLRDYFRLVPERTGGKIVYTPTPLSGPVQSGDIVAVRLTISGAEWRYLQIEDPIPAGTEFIERDDLYEIQNRPSWWGSFYARREFHDDRATFFQTFFGRGQAQQVYLLKVVNPGSFRASAARVQPMYQPQTFSTTEGKTLTVQP